MIIIFNFNKQTTVTREINCKYISNIYINKMINNIIIYLMY